MILVLVLIILSGVSSMLLVFGPLKVISYLDFRNSAIIPSVIIIFTLGIVFKNRFPRLSNRLFIGMAAGALATLALEAIRIPGYMILRWIPMDSMISLPGLLLTGKIESLSEIKDVIMQSGMPMHLYHAPFDAYLAGVLWHFWNGATFGIMYAVTIGKGRWWYGIVWGVIIEVAMMSAPYLIMMKGPFGIQHMDGYNLFVVTLIAHVLFGVILGTIVQKWKKETTSILTLRGAK